MTILAEGYSNSVIIQLKELLNNNSQYRANSIIFPILFNANHTIELYLKAIIWSLNILLDKNERFSK